MTRDQAGKIQRDTFARLLGFAPFQGVIWEMSDKEAAIGLS